MSDKSNLKILDPESWRRRFLGIDLLPKKVTKTWERFPAKLTHGRSHNEEQAIYRRADYWLFEGARVGRQSVGSRAPHGFSEKSFYRWKSKYGGMEVSEAKRLRDLESENARLKKPLAEAELDKAMLKDVVSKKW